MVNHIFGLQSLFPELYSRIEKPVVDIPVFYDKQRISTASLDDDGEFQIVLPPNVETTLSKKRKIIFFPVYDPLNRHPDPQKVKLRLTAIELHLLPRR